MSGCVWMLVGAGIVSLAYFGWHLLWYLAARLQGNPPGDRW